MTHGKNKFRVVRFTASVWLLLASASALAQGLSKAEEKIFNEATTFYSQKTFDDLRRAVVAKNAQNADLLQALDKIKGPLIECAADSMKVMVGKPDERREVIAHYQAVRAGKADYRKNADGSDAPEPLMAVTMMSACLPN
jgi:uncharacterized membrane-anchored protein YhcB (DUF1043 family)